MIYGLGIDIVRIDRVREVIEKWDRKFLERVFTDGEISYCYAKRSPYLSLAVRFAAKEAFIKSIGSEIPVSLTDIEVMNSDTGRPFLKVNGKIEHFFRVKGIQKVHLSLSHEHDYGVACVVLET
jgi:holo-[acyl-carrier protein] synthase